LFKNISIFRITKITSTAESINKGLAGRSFNSVAGAISSSGFAPVFKSGDLAYCPSKSNYLINFVMEKKIVPPSAVKDAVQERVQEQEARTGAKVGRNERRDIKDAVVNEMVRRAFSVRNGTLAWISESGKLLVINSTSNSVIDAFMTAFINCLGQEIQIKPIDTKNSPLTLMNEYLTGASAEVFSVDRDCVLRNPGTKASLKFSNHNLDEASKYIGEGKQPDDLSITWSGRVSFTLNQKMQLKKIKMLDCVTEQAEKIGSEDELSALNGDFAIESVELTGVISDLINQMGGEE
jgi:recombination associated protein RdgC